MMFSARRLEARPHFVGIFVIALVVMAYQVLLTRLFSAVLFYHFAFMGISLAMLGMTLGAQRVFSREARFSADRLESEWARAALGFSLSSAALTLVYIVSPPFLPRNAEVTTALIFIPFVVPFTYGGICVTLILTKSREAIGGLYAADLVGAALGCMLVVGALLYLDPVSLTFALACLSAFAALVMARGADPALATRAGWLGGAFLVALVLQGGLYVTNGPHLKIRWAPDQVQSTLPYERWNAYSHISVGPVPPSYGPVGWGFGRQPTQAIEQMGLIIDASAGTVITRFDGNLEPLGFLANDIINMPYHIRSIDRVAVIGVGGGRDILSALVFGAGHVTGIELNPANLDVLTTSFADFSGHLGQRPGVSLVNAEARSWLNQTNDTFDLVQISLIDTWAATAAGGLALAENKLYTVEAWTDFMAKLSPKGVLSVSRWFEPGTHIGEFYRLLSLAAQTLRQRGVPDHQIRSHILAFRNGMEDGPQAAKEARVVTVIVGAAAFSAEDTRRARQAAGREGFHVMLDADTAWDRTSGVIASGMADEKFLASLPIDVSASTDDRPFFFYVTRLKDVFRQDGSREAEGSNAKAIGIIGFLLVATFACVIGFVLGPLLASTRRRMEKGSVPYLLYFVAIGVGFMLIEISQMQRLIIFLGHPVYGLTVILFTLLLFGGLGSLSVRPAGPLWHQRFLFRGVALCVVLLATGLLTPSITGQLKHLGTPARILSSVLLLAPAGFCMGMMFPMGMLISQHHRALHPWFWGVNGATSVFASVLGVAISMQLGISAAYWIGTAFYSVCLLVLLRETVARRGAQRAAA